MTHPSSSHALPAPPAPMMITQGDVHMTDQVTAENQNQQSLMLARQNPTRSSPYGQSAGAVSDQAAAGGDSVRMVQITETQSVSSDGMITAGLSIIHRMRVQPQRSE